MSWYFHSYHKLGQSFYALQCICVTCNVKIIQNACRKILNRTYLNEILLLWLGINPIIHYIAFFHCCITTASGNSSLTTRGADVRHGGSDSRMICTGCGEGNTAESKRHALKLPFAQIMKELPENMRAMSKTPLSPPMTLFCLWYCQFSQPEDTNRRRCVCRH